MSFESIVNSVITPILDPVVNVVETAVDVAANVASKIQDEVTQALAGDANEEKANADTFEKSATDTQNNAAEIDKKLDVNKDAQEKTKASLQGVKNDIQSTDTEIEDAKTNLKTLQAAQKEQSVSDEENPNAKDLSTEISAAEKAVTQLETKKEELKTEEEDLTKESETLAEEEKAIESEGAQVEADAQGSANEGEATKEEAETTKEEAIAHEKEVEQQEEAAQEKSETAAVEEQPVSAPVAEEVKSEAPIVQEPEVQIPVEQPIVQAPVEEPIAEIQQPVQEVVQTPPVAQEPIYQEPVYTSENRTEQVIEKIERNETTDAQMAEVIIQNMFTEVQVGISTDEIIGMNAQDAINAVAESQKASIFSASVYKTTISSKTDTATIDENRSAMAEFLSAYSDTSEQVNSHKVEFLSLTDKSNYEAATNVANRLNDGEYIITRELEKSTSTVKAIQVSTEGTESTKEEISKTKGFDLLKKLEEVITEDKTIQENKNDDILTQKEYDDLDNFFTNSENFTSSLKQITEEAKKYKIFAA